MPAAMAASRDAVTGNTIFATTLLFLLTAEICRTDDETGLQLIGNSRARNF